MNIKDVENLAELAKIEVSQEEKEQLLKDMEGILSYVKQIQDIEVSESSIEYGHRNAWREDGFIERDFSLEIITEQFPDSQDGFVKVKKIL